MELNSGERQSVPTPTIVRSSKDIGPTGLPERLGGVTLDALLVHGKNWDELPPQNKDIPGFHLRLSLESKINAIAAGILYKKGATKRLMFTGGRTAGSNWPSEAEEMVKYLKVRFPEIPDKAIEIEGNSYDTVDNIKESKKLIEDRGMKNVGYLTVGFHVPRVEMLMHHYGVPIKVIYPSEEILKDRSYRSKTFDVIDPETKQVIETRQRPEFSRRHIEFVGRYVRSENDPRYRTRHGRKKRKNYARQIRGEKILIAESIFDPGHEKLNKWVTPRVRRK